MQASNFIQGLSRSDYYSQLIKLRSVMAEKKMSMWMETEAEPSDESAPNTHFLFSLLEALYDDKVCDTAKCHLLILIEEHFDAFIMTANNASQLVHSLMNTTDNNSQDRRGKALPNYHGYIHQCITAIIIRYDLLQNDPELCEKFIQQLLDLLCMYRGDSLHARFRAIISLEHLEQRYPTFLMWKLEQLIQVCSADYTILFEHCLRLFSLALRNAVDHCVMCEGKWNPDLFHLRTESLRHCQLEFPIIERLRRFDSSCTIKRCLSDVDSQLLNHVQYCLDRVKYLSFWSMAAIFDNLVHIVVRFDNMASSLFKTITLRVMPINMPRLLFSMMQFRIIFSDALLFKEHAALLLHTCLSHMNNARNTIPHRLLTSHWLAQNVALMEAEREAVNVRVMVPTVFDPLDVKYAKMLFLNNFLEMGTGPGVASASVLLLTNIIGIRKLSQYAGPGRITAALYQILFQLYYLRHESPLANDIQGLVLGITKENADFVPYTLDFVDAIHKALPKSSMPQRSAAELSDWACDALPDVINSNAALNYMRILAHSVRQPEVEMAPVVEVMLQLLHETSLCSDGNWTKGNGFLDICRSFLEHRSELATGDMFLGVGDVLSYVSLHFNHLDVRQRAELYYSMLIHLNGVRLERLLAGTSQSPSDTVLRKTDGYPTLPEVCLLDWPVFEVCNIPVWIAEAENPSHQLPSWRPAPAELDLEAYMKFVKEDVTKLPLVLSLTRSEKSKELGILFGLEFACESSCDGMLVSVKTSNCVSMALDAKVVLLVELTNLSEADSFFLTVNASFTKSDGQPSLGESTVLRLELSELILPMPIATKDVQRIILNRLRASTDLLQAFMTLSLDAYQKKKLLEDIDHLLVDEGHYCGFLFPHNHVILDMEEKDDSLYFISIFSDRPSVLKHFYHYLSKFETLQNDDYLEDV